MTEDKHMQKAEEIYDAADNAYVTALIDGTPARAAAIAAIASALSEAYRSGVEAGRTDGVFAFATAILHGDDEHRRWLLDASDAFIGKRPLPPPNGMGRSEALEAAINAAIAALTAAIRKP